MLVCKTFGIILAVSSGMPCGGEGPMVTSFYLVNILKISNNK